MQSDTFPLHAILTLATGRVWGPFSDAHRLAEYLMGYPMWTHELPRLADELRVRVCTYLPAAMDIPEADYPTSPRDVSAKLAAQVARFGDTHTPPAGTGARAESPVSSLVRMVGPSAP